MKYLVVFSIITSLLSCKSEDKLQTLKNGVYRATIETQDNQLLPFNIEVTSPNSFKIFNADEVIEVDEIEYKNDSIFIKTPVFDSYFAGVFEGDNVRGKYINDTRNRIAPFYFEYLNDTRFNVDSAPNKNVTGIWETTFSEDTDDAYKAKGIFNQKDGKVTGTFRTTTGDYRFLDGVMEGDSLKLSTYDGAHAFLFLGEVSDSTINGQFYSGKHWKEAFFAKRNADFELPSTDSLTTLKEGYDRLEFSFPDAQGNMVSLEDERYKDKVVVVQVMGTWCPNCLDGSRYYADYYATNKDKGVEIVALAVEFVKTEEAAFKNIARLREGVGMEYPILLAQYGTGSKAKLQEKLPMINKIISYPTTFFIDKTGKVRKIHTGFNGPGTGEKYVEFKNEFEGFIAQLLAE